MSTDRFCLGLIFVLICLFAGSAVTIIHLINLYGSTIHV